MAQEIIRIETINTDVINVATTEVIKIEGVGLQGNSGDNVGVLSFNGRIGIVSPELDDYQASLITNNSTETGATVKDALDALDIEQGTQDTAIALNTAKRSYPLADENRLAGTSGTNTGDQDLSGIEDAITALDIRVSDNETDITTIQGEQITQDGRLDAIETEQITQNDDISSLGGRVTVNESDIDDLEAEQILQNDAITAIEDTAVFESPISPNPVNYIWLGTDIDYQAIIAPQDDTIYNINNNLETKALWFKTQNVSPITPTITGTVADWKSVGSDEGNNLGVSNPTFTYTDSSIEHLVTATDFDPLDVIQINAPLDGITSISNLSAFSNLQVLKLFLNELTEITWLGNITSLVEVDLFDNDVSDIGDISGLVNLETLQLSLNPIGILGDLSSLNSLIELKAYDCSMTSIGNLNSSVLVLIRLETNALTQTYVDQVFNDVDSLGASNGSLNVSGGTNHYPTLFSKPAIDSLTAKGWTITANTDPNPLSFITSGVSPITPTITGTVADWSSYGSTEGTVLGSSAPTFNYADTGQDYLVEVGNFDPLNVTSIDSNADGLTRIFLQSMPNVKSFKVQNNNSLEYVYGLETLTGIDAELFLYGCDLEGNVTLPNAPNLEIISFRSNPRLTKLNNFIFYCFNLTDLTI